MEKINYREYKGDVPIVGHVITHICYTLDYFSVIEYYNHRSYHNEPPLVRTDIYTYVRHDTSSMWVLVDGHDPSSLDRRNNITWNTHIERITKENILKLYKELTSELL